MDFYLNLVAQNFISLFVTCCLSAVFTFIREGNLKEKSPFLYNAFAGLVVFCALATIAIFCFIFGYNVGRLNP